MIWILKVERIRRHNRCTGLRARCSCGDADVCLYLYTSGVKGKLQLLCFLNKNMHHAFTKLCWKVTWGALSEKLRKNTANIPLYKGDTVLWLMLPSWFPILRWKIRILKEQAAVCVCMCVYINVCVSGETDRRNTWLRWPKRLNYLAFGSLQPWTCQLVRARRKKTLITDPSPVQCRLIWAHSRALNHWSRLVPKQL